MTDGGSKREGTRPRVEPHPLFDGVRMVDPIEGSQFTLLTPTSVDPTACDTDKFYFPVDSAARICTSDIETPYLVDIWIRDTDGNLVAQSTNEESISVPPGEYNLEVSSTQMKLYLAFEGGVSVQTRDERRLISFSETSCVTIGIRSLHEQPAATITTTDEPEDLMEAISAFGSALKTTSCERSFPTLRGHPPLLERGSELDIPDSVETPETDVRIEVPPSNEYIYPITSLAYYLGATVEPGPEPMLVAAGEAFSLTADGDFEQTVARVLRQVFLMDCVTRTEGYYTVDLHERDLVQREIDVDFEALYEQPLAEQLQTYLSIPYETIEAAVPRWKLTADVIPDIEHAETLPFLANDLAVIRCPTVADIKSRSIHSGATTVSEFFGASEDSQRGWNDGTTRSYRTDSDRSGQPFEEHVFRPPEADSVEQTYVGDGVPLGASKMTVDAYYRRLRYEPSESARTKVIVVCNESEMSEEGIVSDIYGTRDWVEFDITIKSNLSTDEMQDVLATDADLLHYIGHVDEEGIRCQDGWLDTNELSEVNISAFILNACKSYEQGHGLIKAGAIGGIVTTTDVLHETATEMGRLLARLLDTGFTLSTSLEIIDYQSIVARQYLIVGDGNAQIIGNESGIPSLGLVKSNGDSYDVSVRLYPSHRFNLGAFGTIYLDNFDSRYLAGSETRRATVEATQLREFLEYQGIPLIIDDGVTWSDDVDI